MQAKRLVFLDDVGLIGRRSGLLILILGTGKFKLFSPSLASFKLDGCSSSSSPDWGSDLGSFLELASDFLLDQAPALPA